jgi:hypothetical protein
VPLLKIKRIQVSDVPNSEGSVSLDFMSFPGRSGLGADAL